MIEKFICFLITTVFCLSLVFANSYDRISKFNHNSSLDEELAQELGRVVRKCLTSTNRLITLSGNISQKLAKEIHRSEYTAVTRISNEVPLIDKVYTIAKQSLAIYHGEFYFRFENKAQGFVLAASSQPILRHQLEELKNSRWWNARAFLFIIDDGTAIINSCKNSLRFLWQAWRYSILSSIFLCHDTSKRLTMYTYNPYNDMVPKNWLKVDQLFSPRDHPWILFQRNLSNGPEKCSDMFYDKTKNLNDYKIRTNALPLKLRLSIDYKKTGLERYNGQEGKMIQAIFHFLNGSVEDIPYTGKDPVGYFDNNGTFFGMLGDIYSGRVDIGLNGRYMVNMWKLGMSYPYTSSAICFVLKSRGNVPQWMNLAFVFDIWISLGLAIAILLNTVILSYYSSVSVGCLNSLRLVISTSIVRPPSQFPARMFLINVLYLFIIANGLFQARLVSFLTKPHKLNHPETIRDLSNEGYKVVGYTPFQGLIDDPVLESSYESSGLFTCNDRMTSGKDIACLMDCDIVYIGINDHTKLHVVRQRLHTFNLIFVTSLDWPLLSRFDQLVQRLSEAGLPDYWKFYDIRAATGRNRVESFEGKSSTGLSFKDLAFIFHWLLFGMFFSTLVFFYELFSVRYGTNFGGIRQAR